jgi:FAD/FMN-containing dehydrogenase
MASSTHSHWSNWAGNQQCAPQRVVHPSTEADVQDAVIDAVNQGLGVRVVGTGHSFSPLSVTDGVLLCLDRMTGVTAIDAARHRVTVSAGTTIRQMGDPLWAARLCLKNQGDIDAQQIAGAIGTATHGSGAAQQCFSAMATKFRVVLATGEVREVSTDDPHTMAAAQVAMGMLGVVTEVALDVREAFGLAENLEYWPVEQVLERFDDEMAHRRHFSFFWMPYDGSPGSLFMDWPAAVGPGDCALVKLYDEVPQSSLSSTPDPGYRRVDRPYRIYPDPDFEGVIVNRELEYFVRYEDGKDAFLALRELILAKYPDQLYPIEVRSIAADDAYLSPFYQRPSISISICGHEDKDYMGFLADVAATLDDFDARPHWGKLNFTTRERITRLYPRLGDFEAVRQKLDPHETFLSPYLSTLFA